MYWKTIKNCHFSTEFLSVNSIRDWFSNDRLNCIRTRYGFLIFIQYTKTKWERHNSKLANELYSPARSLSFYWFTDYIVTQSTHHKRISCVRANEKSSVWKKKKYKHTHTYIYYVFQLNNSCYHIGSYLTVYTTYVCFTNIKLSIRVGIMSGGYVKKYLWAARSSIL